jgi:hypothetical protein
MPQNEIEAEKKNLAKEYAHFDIICGNFLNTQHKCYTFEKGEGIN